MAHTPGPWRWEVSTDNHLVYLQGTRPPRLYVMDFVRWGMRGAAPRFQVRKDGFGGVMVRVDELAVQRQSHHVGWNQWINHPDALLIAAAPELLDACKVALEDLINTFPDEADLTDDARESIRTLRAAIAESEGK